MSFKGEYYFQLLNRNMIPKKWHDIYEWVAGGVTPFVWREALLRTEPDNQTDREEQRRSFHSSM